jgi:hypothetical protein
MAPATGLTIYQRNLVPLEDSPCTGTLAYFIKLYKLEYEYVNIILVRLGVADSNCIVRIFKLLFPTIIQVSPNGRLLKNIITTKRERYIQVVYMPENYLTVIDLLLLAIVLLLTMTTRSHNYTIQFTAHLY